MAHPRMYDDSDPVIAKLREICLAFPEVFEKEAWGECTFRVAGGNEEFEKKFAKEAAAARLIGLAGHRSIGGMRASIYNAVTIETVRILVDFMREFQKANG